MIPGLPPMAYTVFAQRPLPTREQIIEIVNRAVNAMIRFDGRAIPVEREAWSIAPQRGQCHDYAVTKQWMLARFGIPSRLCECVIEDGQHHLVLLVDDKVLDNRTPMIGPQRYVVARTQSAADPDRWDS